MSAIDWAIIGALPGLDRLGRHQAEPRHRQARRLLPRQQEPAVVGGRLVGDGDAAVGDHDGQQHRPGLRRRHGPAAAVLRAADRDDHHRRSRSCRSSATPTSTPPTSISSGRFDAKTRSFTALLFLISRGMSTRRRHLRAGGGAVGDDRRRRQRRLRLLLGVPTAIYTMFGGVQAVAWTDVKQMYLIVGGLIAACVALDRRPARARSASASACTSPAPPDACRRSTSRPTRSVRFTFWTGTHRRAVPVPVVLRHRSEPGAALPDREVGGRGAHVAVHERLLEDPAAGAGDDHRRA